MKRNVKLTLAIISIFLIASEFFYGIPFLGGSVILGFGWQPLLLNALLYLILGIILFIGLIGSFVAFLPIIGMFTHWILFFLMVFFIFVVLNAPTYIPNKDSKVIYTQYKKDDKNN